MDSALSKQPCGGTLVICDACEKVPALKQSVASALDGTYEEWVDARTQASSKREATAKRAHDSQRVGHVEQVRRATRLQIEAMRASEEPALATN